MKVLLAKLTSAYLKLRVRDAHRLGTIDAAGNVVF